MRPQGRVQAAIELLDQIIDAARDDGASADIIAARYFKTRRYIGSKDRRAIREHAYEVIRRFGDRPKQGRAGMIGLAQENPELAKLFDGETYSPALIKEGEARADSGAIPLWLLPLFAEPIDEQERGALLDRAPLDIRVNARKTLRYDVMEDWPEAEELSSPNAIRLPSGTQVEKHLGWLNGHFEVQDHGSQIICNAAEAEGAKLALDLCAGAGGKTLGLAASMAEDARIIAADIDRGRLSRQAPRLRRAGIENVETLLLNPRKERAALSEYVGKCDLVLIDAPCTGTGTWRRNPETRWRMTPRRLGIIKAEQARILEIGAEMVAPGGKLLYAVCSLLEDEGAGQINAFLNSHPEWDVDWPSEQSVGANLRRHGKGMILSPYHDGTDGFFFARLKKPC